MITSRDVRQEIKDNRAILESDKPVEDKLKALYKLVEVTLKVAVDTRTNTVKVMEKLGVAKVVARKPQDNAKKTETTTE